MRADGALTGLLRGLAPADCRVALVLLDRDGTRAAFQGGVDADTPFEIGSLTTGLTGLALADGIERGELALDDPLGRHMPELSGPVADLSLRSVVTHRSGLPRLLGGHVFKARAWWAALRASNPYRDSRLDLLRKAGRVRLGPAGTFVYSNLGAALAGHAGAAAARQLYAGWLHARVLVPLGMTDTWVAQQHHPAPAGRDVLGRRAEPWVLDGHAPAGGVVSTPRDMARLLRGLVHGTAPGPQACEPLAEVDGRDVIGFFWLRSGSRGDTWWHDGGTGGYTSYLAFNRAERRGLVVLSEATMDAADAGRDLMLHHR